MENDRRDVLAAGAGLGLVLMATQSLAQDAETPEIVTPRTRLVFTAHVTIAGLQVIGQIPTGQGRLVPITGGTFEGPDIRGRVLPGGADWQTVRDDGVTELAAHYGLESDDGAIIQVWNNVVISPRTDGRYARSVMRFSAPAGPHDWLNKSVFVGTLNAPGDSTAPVVIRCFEVV